MFLAAGKIQEGYIYTSVVASMKFFELAKQ